MGRLHTTCDIVPHRSLSNPIPRIGARPRGRRSCIAFHIASQAEHRENVPRIGQHSYSSLERASVASCAHTLQHNSLRRLVCVCAPAESLRQDVSSRPCHICDTTFYSPIVALVCILLHHVSVCGCVVRPGAGTRGTTECSRQEPFGEVLL